MRDEGTLKSPIFIRDTIYEAPLSPREVEIQAEVWGFTERDIACAYGRAKYDLLGGDCGGVITRVGSECDTGFQIGDRVCMSVVGCMRKYPRSHETGVVKIPENWSIEGTISILNPAIIAYHALVDISRLGQGDAVFVHLAASSVGQVAVRIAQRQNAHVYATRASPQEERFLVEALGIPAENIFDFQDLTFGTAVVRATDGQGVDIVLNSLAGEDLLRASCECLALGGRFIEISQANFEANLNLPLQVFARNITFSVVDSTQLRPEVLSRVLKAVIKLIGDGELQIPRPPPISNVSQLEQAFKEFQENETMSHIVITAGPEDVIPVVGPFEHLHVFQNYQLTDLPVQQFVKQQPPWSFDMSASYLVAGGFGGIGRAILQWMADRGAKQLIVPSRSGAVSKAAVETVAQLTARGVTVIAPQCDVSSEASLSHVLEECARTMPPIKGCINAAMVLQDGIFQENMTFDKWDLTMKSKVQTSWNLHRLLPEHLDFFILLSSLAGVVGQMASSNYAGGCTFQDALARHRVAQGQPAVSIDIGWMRNIGIIAETGAYQRQRQAADDMRPIDGAELLALLTMYCNPDAPRRLLPSEGQVLFGLQDPTDYLAQGRALPALLDRPLLAAFSYIPDSDASPSQEELKPGARADPGTLFRQSTDSTERIQIVLRALAIKLAGAMSISPEDVEVGKPLSSYGVDSLMAVDLRNWIRTKFGATVTVFDIMSDVPLASIADLVVEKSSVEST